MLTLSTLQRGTGAYGTGRRRPRIGSALAVALLFGLGACRAGTLAPGEAAGANPATNASAPSTNGNTSAPANPNVEGAFDGNALLGPALLGPGANPALVALARPILAASAASGVAANVLAGIIWAESRADAKVAGGGLMQMGDAEFAAQKAAHPQIQGEVADAGANVMAGAFYLVQLQGVMRQKFGRADLGVTLRAYNSGELGVDPNDLTALPAGTGASAYVVNVTSFARIVATGVGSLPP